MKIVDRDVKHHPQKIAHKIAKKLVHKKMVNKINVDTLIET